MKFIEWGWPLALRAAVRRILFYAKNRTAAIVPAASCHVERSPDSLSCTDRSGCFSVGMESRHPHGVELELATGGKARCGATAGSDAALYRLICRAIIRPGIQECLNTIHICPDRSFPAGKLLLLRSQAHGNAYSYSIYSFPLAQSFPGKRGIAHFFQH